MTKQDRVISQTGQVGAEIEQVEITPQMIEAGVRELSEWRFIDAPEKIVWEVYAAMEYERRDNQTKVSASATSPSK